MKSRKQELYQSVIKNLYLPLYVLIFQGALA